MSSEFKLQTFQSNKLVYQYKNGTTFEFDESIKDVSDLCEAYIELLKQNKERAVKVVKWPSEDEILQKRLEIAQGETSYSDDIDAMIDWLRSQVKPFELPEFTNDGCDEWLSEMKRLNPNIHPHSSTFSHMETGYEAGFNKCLELIKQKLGG